MKILFYDVNNFELEYLREKLRENIEARFFRNSLSASSYICEKYYDCDALSVFVNSFLTESVLSQFRNLKYIFLRCSGYSNVDLNYCKKKNILVFNTPHYAKNTVSEYAFALILNLSRKISQGKTSVLLGHADSEELIGFELWNKTIGIIGLGSIGKKIAQIASAFNMKILAYDVIQDTKYKYVSLDELYKKSDVIVLSCPLNSKTYHMINSDSLSKIKESAILINVSRGELVDTIALTKALVDEKIKGAALDVIECEEKLCHLWDFCIEKDELKEHCLKKFLFIEKLKKMDNVIITPHNAYNTIEAKKRILNITLENIKSVLTNLNTSDLKNLVML